MSTKNGDYVEAQKELEEERQKTEGAISQAATSGYDQAEINKNRAFFEEYSDPDVTPDPNASDMEKRMAPELSHHHLFGNIDQAEYERRMLDNQVLAMRVKSEFPRPSGVSSKCTGEYREAIAGDEKPVMSPEMNRHVDSILGPQGVRAQMQSQSIQASAWKGITTMKSVIETMGENAKSASAGALGKAKKFLFGSDS